MKWVFTTFSQNKTSISTQISRRESIHAVLAWNYDSKGIIRVQKGGNK